MKGFMDGVEKTMKTPQGFLLGSLLLLAATPRLPAQSYSIDWSKIAGGGGTSTGGIYSLSGTIGQHDAGATMTGGGYSLTGGFWSLIAAVPTPGLPDLTIRFLSPQSVVVSWPNTVASTLLINNNLSAPGQWTAFSGPVTTSNGTNSVTITPPSGNLFFRLKAP